MQVLAARITPYAGVITSWFVAQVGSIGALFLQFLLTVIAAAVLYGYGEDAADWALRFGARTGGSAAKRRCACRGRRSAAWRAGWSYGNGPDGGGGIGLWIAGVPFATLLTALMFLLAVAQVGAALVLAGATIWLYWTGSPGWGTFLLVVTIIAGTLDNVLRPILIKQGAADLPLLLIFVGVIGGLIAFGLIGIFVGPVVLAVTYTLLRAWLHDDATRRRGNREQRNQHIGENRGDDGGRRRVHRRDEEREPRVARRAGDGDRGARRRRRAAEQVARGKRRRGGEHHRRDRPRPRLVERPPQLGENQEYRHDEQHGAGAPDRRLDARGELAPK